MSQPKSLLALAALLGSIAGAVHGADPRPEKPRRKIPNPAKQAAAQAKRDRKAAKRRARP